MRIWTHLDSFGLLLDPKYPNMGTRCVKIKSIYDGREILTRMKVVLIGDSSVVLAVVDTL